mgnify:CR=1 FL=1
MKFTTQECEQMLKDGLYFNFGISHAINLGYEQKIRDEEPFTFEIGNFMFEWLTENYCFKITHKDWFLALMIAGYTYINFSGGDENEYKEELLIEYAKLNEQPRQPHDQSTQQ